MSSRGLARSRRPIRRARADPAFSQAARANADSCAGARLSLKCLSSRPDGNDHACAPIGRRAPRKVRRLPSPFTYAISTLNDRALRSLLGARAFLRGYDYVRRRAVEYLELGEASARGEVKGTEPVPYQSAGSADAERLPAPSAAVRRSPRSTAAATRGGALHRPSRPGSRRLTRGTKRSRRERTEGARRIDVGAPNDERRRIRRAV